MNYKTGERLAKYRKKANMSQEELADKLNVSRQAVSKWERGESSPDTDNLIALASLRLQSDMATASSTRNPCLFNIFW